MTFTREDEEIIEKINKVEPDFLWVGLGAPKQEIWDDKRYIYLVFA